jgi:hypothetical protein
VASLIAVVRALPWALFGRLTTALVEIVLAVMVLSTSVVVGHELRDWRTYYAEHTKPWAPSRAPVASPVAEPRP